MRRIWSSIRPVDYLSDRITCPDLCQKMHRTPPVPRPAGTPRPMPVAGGPAEHQRSTRRTSGQGRTRQQGTRTHQAPPLRSHQRSRPEHPHQSMRQAPSTPPVLTTNKYRSREEQVPFSRGTSTVLATNKYRSREEQVPFSRKEGGRVITKIGRASCRERV